MSKEIVQEVLGRAATKELWSTAYRPVLPVTPQDFALGGVLPAVFYMMRYGHRRGQGKFGRTYGEAQGGGGRAVATIARVAARLAGDATHFAGFDGDVERAVLGDLLLAFCLENKKHGTGRDEQVQRAFPTHYFSSWIDLPANVANLRGVPELIVTVLARQEDGRHSPRHFPVGSDFQTNLLLQLFGVGTSIRGQRDSLTTSDAFDEEATVGIDQLLTIRLAQSLREAPLRMGGESPEIPKQRPLAGRAADILYEDFNVFLRAYGRVIPRQSLLPMLESCLAVGLTNVYLSTVRMVLEWSKSGEVLAWDKQKAWPLFVDCSVSTDADLRRLSEDSLDDLLRRLTRLPVWLMCLRILDRWARGSMNLPPSEPDPAARIAHLGSLLRERDHEEVRHIEWDLRHKCRELAEKLTDEPEVQAVLTTEGQHPAWRLAEGLIVLIGDKQQFGEFRKHLDSCLMVNDTNGLGRRRRTTVRGKLMDRRSIVLSNTALDYLAHRHLRKAKRGTGLATLSLTDFLAVLRDRYGFFIHEAPEGMAIPVDMLERNRAFFETRLRDMGLLVGVNDAESMKRLRPRFEADRA